MKNEEKASISIMKIICVSIILVLISGIGVMAVSTNLKDVKIVLQNGYEIFTPSRQELNLEDEKSIENFIMQNKDRGFDIIINNAGINEVSFIENITDAEIESMLKIKNL